MSVRSITAIALFAAFITVLGFVPPVFLPFFPLVPVSVHSIAPILAGAMLGAKRGFYAVVLYWILLAAGLAFAGGSTGLAAFLSPMGGYIIGFGLAAFVTGAFYQCFPRANIVQEFFFAAAGGIIALYTAGILWLIIWTKMSLHHALWLNTLFLPGDFVKIAACIFIRRFLKRSLPTAFRG